MVEVYPTASRRTERSYPPFIWGLLSLILELFGLPHEYTKSGGNAIRIARVVVDAAVSVHIHEVGGVARIRGTEPPIDGDYGI